MSEHSAEKDAGLIDVARLTRPEREGRVIRLVSESYRILDEAIEEHVVSAGKNLAGVVTLFSGGNDSTVLAHLFRDVATHAAHANTTIGIEKTRDFVRNVCEEWGLPLLERTPPREADHYRALVLDQGFPGPGHHFKMFQRLKERALRQVRSELVTARSQRVVFLAGRRRSESQRRANVPASERDGSIVWVSPLVNWTKLDLTTYRLMASKDDWEAIECGRCHGCGTTRYSNTDDQDDGLAPDLTTPRECPRCFGSGTQDRLVRRANPVPVNEVSDLIHMSGECLCGSFAAPGEREELAYWFPATVAEIAALEVEIADRGDIPAHRKTWGWGADPTVLKASRKPSKVGALCSSCDDRFQAVFNFEETA